MVGYTDKKLVVLLTALLLFILPVGAYDIKSDLASLDDILAQSETFVQTKRNMLERMELELASSSQGDSRQKYDQYTKLYNQYFSFQFDKALQIAEEQEQLALRLKDRELINQSVLRKAKLYCVGGFYKECENTIKALDTLSLSTGCSLLWYELRQQFCYDFVSNSGTPGGYSYSQARYYRQKYMELCPPQSFELEYMKLLDCFSNGDYDGAWTVGEGLIKSYNTGTHEYARVSFYLGMVCSRRGDYVGTVHWLCESAKADLVSAVKDNASLYNVSVYLVARNMEVERAFRYTQKALDDALFFNGNLRLNQIVRSLPDIETAYSADRAHTEHTLKLFILLVIGLAFGLGVFVILHLVNHHRLQKSVSALREANVAKEEFLALFLSMSASYLDKLRPFLGRQQMDLELKEFYRAFDVAVLQLYPHFVEDFNALLIPEQRVVLKKGEVLNTELRIFALILLGVDQSSHIASLLRYSVNTIYNYRAQVKSYALNTDIPFEQQVKSLGL